MAGRQVQGFNVARILRDARRVYVTVMSRSDPHIVRITKAEARWLLEADGFSVRCDADGDVYIEAADPPAHD